MAKEKGQKGSGFCSFVFTILVMCCGLALLVMGIWIRTDPLVSHLGPLVEEEVWTAGDDLHINLSVVHLSTLIAMLEGSLIVFFMGLACVGVTGSKYSAQCYIGTYILCLLATIGFSIAFFVKGAPNHWSEGMDRLFRYQLEHHYEGENGNGSFTKVFNTFQQDEGCCGIHGRMDYNCSNSFNSTECPNQCTMVYNGSESLNCTVPCVDEIEEGCLEKLLSRATLYFALTAGISLGSILIEIPALLNALCQCSDL